MLELIVEVNISRYVSLNDDRNEHCVSTDRQVSGRISRVYISAISY